MSDIENIADSRFGISFNEKYVPYVMDLLAYSSEMNWSTFQSAILRKYRFSTMPRRIEVSYIYRTLLRQNKISPNKSFEAKVITKQACGMSGVMVVTIATKPDRFSCKYDCHYCPNESINNMPRSYLSNEPVLARAVKCGFDTVEQFHKRANILYYMEHKLDKLEVIVVGGTWSCYDHAYQDEFIRDVYYASNIFYDTLDGKQIRERLDLETEKAINETAQCRIISITLETRPDQITKSEIIRFRKFGVTRVQIGVQHTNDDILRYVNRRCYYADTVRAIKLLKDNFFKVDAHYMPNLPSSTPEKDIEMFRQVITNPDLLVDQWKIYPCEVLPFTKIKEWYELGTYTPYSETDLMRVLEYALTNVPPYVRINRVIRDFQMADVIAGLQHADIRDIVQRNMMEKGIECQEIRTREVKNIAYKEEDIKLVTRKYYASDGLEYFLSHESHDGKILYSLLRLRINSIHNECVYPELKQTPAIRELHIYGQMIEHHAVSPASASQHKGLGKILIQSAIDLVAMIGYDSICVISGEGVKGYYKKLGFVEAVGGYLIKHL